MMVDKQRASHVLDELGVSGLDPMRGTYLDFAQRPIEEQVLFFVVNQEKLINRVKELEVRFDNHAEGSKIKERAINGFVAFGMYTQFLPE